MNRREQLQERYEDALFALLMDDYAVLEGEQALQENERLRSDPAAEIPKEMKSRSKKTIQRIFSARTGRSAGRVMAKAVQHAAVVGFAAVLLFTVVFAASSNFRSRTLNIFINNFGDRTVIYAEPTVPQQIYTNWMPTGYKQTDYEAEADDVTARYQTRDGKEIRICLWNLNRNTVIDTENAEVGTADINGVEAVTIVKEGVDGDGGIYESSSVIWVDPMECFVEILSYHEPVDTLIQIARALTVE